MFRYAQVDLETGIVKCDSWLSGEVNHSHMIPIAEDFDTTNKNWDFETETWVEYTPEPIPEGEPSQLDRIEEAVNEIKNSENSEAINALLGG